MTATSSSTLTQWLYGFALHGNVLLLPLAMVVLLAVIFIVAWLNTQSGFLLVEMSTGQSIGTCAMFVLMPGYLLLMMQLQMRHTHRALEDLQPITTSAQLQPVYESMVRPGGIIFFALIGGAIFGITQNWEVIEKMIELKRIPVLDLVFTLGNALVWGMAGLLLCWRIPVSGLLSELGRRLPVDLYRLERVRPLARLATTDVLVVAGAMALMPLQALDAEFRIWNYQWGILIGVPAAILLFLLPLWGIRERIKLAKAERMAALNQQIAMQDREDVVALEALVAHADRIRSLPNWPLDLKLVTRIFAYVIIPPAAWVAAALVENAIERL
ncbi:MAG: hypothetical protein ACR2PZ_25545 [Pseudomonadales bacterium]